MSEDEDEDEGFSSHKEMFDFSNCWTKSKYYDNSKKFVIRKMKDETGGIAIEVFFGMKPKMYSFRVDTNEHKKAKGVNDAAISHNEYKDVFLNQKCISHLMNRIQSNDHRTGTYEINKIS